MGCCLKNLDGLNSWTDFTDLRRRILKSNFTVRFIIMAVRQHFLDLHLVIFYLISVIEKPN